MYAFRLHSSKLEPYMLKLLSRALEKGASNLELVSFQHCRCGDIGLSAFLDTLSRESFPNLKHLILTNNYFSKFHHFTLIQNFQEFIFSTRRCIRIG